MNINYEGQGLTIIDEQTGRVYVIPAGGSDAPVASEGAEGGGEVQSSEDGGEAQSQPSVDEGGGQDLIQPYLESVDESIRPKVAEVLESYRKDQDANFNKALEQRAQEIQQLEQQYEVPVSLYQALLEDPTGTIEWVAERFQEERGIDVRSQLLEQWQQVQDSVPEGQQATDKDGKPLTTEDIERILEEREQAKQQETQKQQREREQIEQAQKTVQNWIGEAAKSHSLELQENDPLIPAIIQQATTLQNRDGVSGQQAIEMVVESFAKRFGNVQSTNEGGKNNPRLAEGGSIPPPSGEIDVSDASQRKARMEEIYTATTGEGN